MLRAMAILCMLCAASSALAVQNVVVVLDDSGSMNEPMQSDFRLDKMTAAKQALLTVLEQVPEEANVGVMLLNGKPEADHWAYRLDKIDRQRLETAINSIRAAGGTPLGESVKAGVDALLKARDEQHYGTYRLLIVTDGEATDGNRVDLYLPDILSRGVRLDVIGVDMERNHSLATKVHNYRRADDPQSLKAAITEVFAESTGSGDADESDFEIIAGLPDDLAGKALLALSTSGNDPIAAGEKRVVPDFAEPAANAPNAATFPATDKDGAPADADTDGGNFLLFAIIALIFFFWVIGAAAKKKRYR